MKIGFDCLGPVDRAEISLAPLTILTGENNTGKTYVTYAIYALLSSWRSLLSWQVSDEHLRTLEERGSIEIDLVSSLAQKWPEIKNATAQAWKEYLPFALAAPESRFQKTCLSFDFDLDQRWIDAPFEATRLSDQGKVVISANKPAGSHSIQLAALREAGDASLPRYLLEDFVRDVIIDAVFSAYISNVFMASAERTGAAVFKDELNLTKNKIVTLLAQIEKTQHVSPMKLFDAIYKSGYPLPVNQNVKFVNALSQYDGRVSPLATKHPHLMATLKRIAGGDFQTNKEGTTFFVPSGTKEKLNLTEASSAVRSILVLWYWLIGEASQGSILMIDEPEMNLHPANQRLMARWIAQLVNAGVSVFITTHSDYIVKELNSLIMFSQPIEAVRAIAVKEKYLETEFLKSDQVRLFVCKKIKMTKVGNKKRSIGMTIVEADKSPHIGVEVSTFDTEINAMNSLAERIYYASDLG